MQFTKKTKQMPFLRALVNYCSVLQLAGTPRVWRLIYSGTLSMTAGDLRVYNTLKGRAQWLMYPDIPLRRKCITAIRLHYITFHKVNFSNNLIVLDWFRRRLDVLIRAFFLVRTVTKKPFFIYNLCFELNYWEFESLFS